MLSRHVVPRDETRRQKKENENASSQRNEVSSLDTSDLLSTPRTVKKAKQLNSPSIPQLLRNIPNRLTSLPPLSPPPLILLRFPSRRVPSVVVLLIDRLLHLMELLPLSLGRRTDCWVPDSEVGSSSWVERRRLRRLDRRCLLLLLLDLRFGDGRRRRSSWSSWEEPSSHEIDPFIERQARVSSFGDSISSIPSPSLSSDGLELLESVGSSCSSRSLLPDGDVDGDFERLILLG